MLKMKTYTCVRCGKTFTKAAGGIVMSPKQMELEMHPVCDQCKLRTIRDIFH